MQLDIASSHFALVFTAGLAAHIGLLNLWFWRTGAARARDRAHLWVAVFCFASLGFQAARYVELHTELAEMAVLMVRLEIAIVPLLGGSLVFFGWALRHRSWKRWQTAAFLAGSATISVAALATDVFIANQAIVTEDWFGREHFGVQAKPAFGLFLPYVAGLLMAISRDVRRAGTLAPRERRMILWSLSAYAAVAVQSTFAAMGLIDMPGLLAYGPIVVAVGLNHLLVDRHRRIQTELEAMVCERTDELLRTNAELAAKIQEVTAARDEAGAANAQLVESRSRYRDLVESAPLGIVACDRGGNVTMVNGYLMRMVGAPSEQFSGTASLLETPRLRQAGLTAPLARCMDTGRTETFEANYISRYGKALVMRVHLAALRDRAGEITGAQAIIEDVADRKDLEERVRHSQKMEAIGGLAAGIAHEINNPMAYVRSNLTMLQQEAAMALEELSKTSGMSHLVERFSDCSELVAESLEGVNRTIAIVREVKEFSHMGEAPEDRVDVNEILADCIRVAETQLPSSVELQAEWGEPLMIRCSLSRMRQVFLNLIMNAAHAAGEKGRVEIETAREDAELCIRVKDNGRGIPDEVRPRIFEPFFTTKQAGEGTGLGLYISYQLVRQQNGTIRVESPPEGGTVFEVRLPGLARP